MKMRCLPLSVVLLSAFSARAQVTITAADMFNEVGLYYRAYANHFDPHDPTTSFPVGNLMGNAGTNIFWNFADGPTNEIWRFDYVSPTGLVEAASFPLAKIVERKSVEETNTLSYLMFEQVPAVGRKVYGFYDIDFSPDTPDNVFNPPIIDFPNQISYGSTWMTSTTDLTSIGLVDPEVGGLSLAAQITFSSDFKADAWGVMDLPQLGLVDVLRVNETQTINVAVDLDGQGQFQDIETDYARTYYWLSPGHGIVAQLASTQGSTPPDDNFGLATAFVRMFETNKKPGTGGCTQPAPVTDLRLRMSNGKILLQWTKTDCANQYRVEYSTSPSNPSSWQPLGNPTADNVLLDTTVGQSAMRFYRVVSLP